MTEDLSEQRSKCDDWRGIKDPKKRKQIQDRLAQRARRKRLAARNANQRDNPGQVAAKCQDAKDLSSVSNSTAQCRGRTVVGFGLFGLMPFADPGSTSTSVVVPQVVDGTRPPESCQTAYAALFDNGQRLGLVCGRVKRSLSSSAGPDIPYYLRATDLQKTVLHAEWIDRFPFPYMRDTCISSLNTTDEERFLADLFRMPSLLTMHGYASWDPKGWMITSQFKDKASMNSICLRLDALFS